MKDGHPKWQIGIRLALEWHWIGRLVKDWHSLGLEYD